MIVESNVRWSRRSIPLRMRRWTISPIRAPPSPSVPPIIRRRPAGRSACCSSISARRTPPTLVGAALPARIPLRQPGDRGRHHQMEVRAQRHHSAAPPGAQRPATTRRSGTGRANELPLKTITRVAGGQAVRRARHSDSRPVVVDWAMRYGNPSIRSRLTRWSRRVATGSWWCRCIRNTPRPPARPSATKPSAR